MNDYSNIKRYPSYEEARKAYFEELDHHDRLIKEAFDKYGELLADTLGVDVNKLKQLVNIHDRSKYEVEDEINGFMANYFAYDGDGIDEEYYGLRRAIYEKGLLSHFHNNPHHPEFWVFIKAGEWAFEAKPMDSIYICEMLLDWIAYKNMLNIRSIKDYWVSTRSTKYIHKDTIKIIDTLVNMINEIEERETAEE